MGENRLSAIKFRKRALEILDLGNVIDRDIRLGWIVDQVVLVITLRRIETLERIYASDDRPRKCVCLIQLADIGLRMCF